jgi:Fur family transcriptional regulator, ferric uptake regulator
MPQARGTKVRYTRQAAAVIAAMSRMPAFSGAGDIREAVRRAGGRVGLATVYRHLHLLAEQGRVDIIHGAHGRTLYRLRRDGFSHHLICRVCDRAVEVDGHEVWEWGRKVTFAEGFTLAWVTIELKGICADHASGATPRAPGSRQPAAGRRRRGLTAGRECLSLPRGPSR